MQRLFARLSSLPSLTLAALCVITTHAHAQRKVYDDFSGTTVDQGRWFRAGDPAKSTQSNGLLRLDGTRQTEDFGVNALSGLRGDFDLRLEFRNFRAPSSAGAPALQLYVCDPYQRGQLRIGLVMSPTGKRFVAKAERPGKTADCIPSGVTTATAGELRLVRTSTVTQAQYLIAGSNKVVTLARFPNFFLTSTVSFVIESEAGSTDSVSVDCNRVTYSGSTVSGVRVYGARCLRLGAMPAGYPELGNRRFELLVLGEPSFRQAPFLMAFGAARISIGLGAAAPGCTFLASPAAVVAGRVLDNEGEGGLVVPIPGSQQLRGVRFVAQFVAVTRANAMGLAWSNGMECTIF